MLTYTEQGFLLRVVPRIIVTLCPGQEGGPPSPHFKLLKGPMLSSSDVQGHRLKGLAGFVQEQVGRRKMA